MKKQGFLYGSGILMASMLAAKLLGAFFKLPLANLLRESGMGYFNTAYTLYTVVYALTVTGLSTAVAKLTAELSAQGKYRDMRRLRRLACGSFFVLGAVGMLVILLGAGRFSLFMKSENSYWAMLAIAPSILFCAQMAAYRGYYEGLSDMKPTALSQALEALIRVAAGLALAALVFRFAGQHYEKTLQFLGVAVSGREEAMQLAVPFAAAAALAGVSFSTLLGLLYLMLRFRIRGDGLTKAQLSEAPPPEQSAILLKRLFRFAVPVTAGAAVLQLSALIDVVTIQTGLSALPPELLLQQYGQYLKSGEQVHEFLYGCFTSVVILFNLVPSFTNIFGKSGLPGITAAWTRRERLALRHRLETMLQVTALVAAPMSLGLCFLAEPILRLFFGGLPGTVAVGTPLLQLMAIASFFLALTNPVNAIFQGMGETRLPVFILLVGAAIKLIGNLIFLSIPSLNILGAALSTLLCYTLIAILSFLFLRQKVSVPICWRQVLCKPLEAAAVCGFCAFCCNYALTRRENTSIITIISVLCGAFFYGLTLIVLRIGNGETTFFAYAIQKIQLLLAKKKKIV